MENKEKTIEKIIIDAKKAEAVKTLVNLGVLIPYNKNISLFHGRANVNNEVFYVKQKTKKIDERGTKRIPGLHTSNKDIALSYAEARATQKNKLLKDSFIKGEVFKIVPTKQNLYIIDRQRLYEEDNEFLTDYLQLSKKEVEEISNYKLSDNNMEKMKDAFCSLSSCYSIDKILPKYFKTPISFKILEDMKKICTENERKGKKPLIYYDDIDDYIEKTGAKDKKLSRLINNIAINENTLSLLSMGEINFLVNRYQANFDISDGFSFGLEFIKEFFKKENIIGVRQKIWVSNVINKKNFEECFFFNTKNIKAVEKKQEENTKLDIKSKSF